MVALVLAARYFRAHPSDAMPGLTDEPLRLDPRQTAFVELHCWNVGFPDGPPVPRDYWVDMGSPENHRLAAEIVCEKIKPALEAARSRGLPVFHVQPETIARKHPQSRYLLAPETAATPKTEAIPGYRQARADRVHGPGYLDWAGWETLDIPRVVYPRPDEHVIVTGAQFDRILRQKGIVTLIYTGFATNLCLLDSPAATKEMASYGYRVLLIRECTLAVEFPDTIGDLTNTRVATRYLEAWVGGTVGLREYLAACHAIGDDAARQAVAS